MTAGAEGALEGSWAEIGTPPRQFAACVVDSVANRLLLIGGADGRGTDPVVWTLDLGSSGSWRQLATSGTSAPAWERPGAAIDPLHRRIFLAGAKLGSAAAPQQIFVLSYGASPRWDVVVVAGAPSARFAPGLSYDVSRNRLVLHGGISPDGGTQFTDAWTLTLGATPAWAPFAISGTPPSLDAQSGESLVDDAERDRLLLVGTTASIYSVNLTGTPAWTSLVPTPTDADPRAVLDPLHHELLVVGGDGSAAALSLGALSWRTLASPGGAARVGTALAVDAARARLLEFGGHNASVYGTRGDLLALPLAGGAWSETGPHWTGPRQWHQSVLDPQRDRVVVYSGLTDSPFDTLMALPAAVLAPWQVLPPPGARPRARVTFSMIADPLHDRMLVFGGAPEGPGPTEFLADLWSLSLSDPPVWTPIVPDGPGPSGRRYAGIWYDTNRDRLLLFGGDDGSQYLEDCWQAQLHGDHVAWTQLLASGQLPFAYSGPILGDPLSDTVYSHQYPNQLWKIALPGTPSFSVSSPGGPGALPQGFGLLGYDSRRQRLVGAQRDDNDCLLLGQLFTLSLAPPGAWVTHQADGAPPPPRFNEATVYDPLTDRFITHGGYDNDAEYYSDTWALQYDQPTATLATLALATADGARTHLEWAADGWHAASVQRMRAGGDWTTLGTRVADGDARITYDDAPLAMGERVAYRLALGANASAPFTAATWLARATDVAAFALAGPTTNPCAGEMVVSFALPSAAPATLELLDLAGRRCEARDVGALGAGSHRLALAAAGAHAPGVYFLRLTQGGERRTARAVIVR